MSSKNIITLITGANQGVGFETAKNLVRGSPDFHVLIGSRDLARGTAAVAVLQALPDIKGTVEAIQIDVTDDASVDAAAASVLERHGRLDVLVNNAGVVHMGDPSRDQARRVWATNVTGYISVTEAFLPLLRASAARSGPKTRLVLVSSSTGSFTLASDPASALHRAGATEYRAGNAARNMLMHQYYLRLRSEGIAVLGADPGLVASNFTGDAASLRARGAAEPDVGGERIASVARGDRDADAGRVCGDYGVCPW